MSRLQPKLETAANIAIIVVALLIVGIFVQRYFFPSNPESEKSALPPGPSQGSKVNLADYEWSKHQQTVLLVLQKGCIYCTESAPFYQRLVKDTAGKNIKLVAVLPQPKGIGEIYLADLGISGLETRESTLQALSVRGTPTLIIVNDKGEVVNAWTGKLGPEKEQEVYKQLQF